MPHMNEVQRRVVAGSMSEMLGRGGKSAVAVASGMSRNTVIKAEGEVKAGIEPSARLRAPGGGDKSLLDTRPGLLQALDELVNPETRGSPMSKLRWTSKSSTKLAEELGLRITVCDYPPGTSKWNRIEHRMFSFITMNRRGKPLTTLRTVIELISATSTTTGLTIKADYDLDWYPKGVKVTDAELTAVPLEPHDFHGEWNYTINAQSDAA